MARLPFQQATVLPQQNRLQAPSVPNAPGPMPTQVPGANARYQALQSLGESIAKIGRTAADIYLTQAEKEQDEQAKIAIVQAGQFIDNSFNEHLADQKNEPAKDATEAMLRYSYFLNGAEGTGGLDDNEGTGIYQAIARQYKNAPKRVKDAVEQLLKDKEIQTRHLLKIRAVDRNNALQVSQSVLKGQQSLFNFEQDLTPEYYAGTVKMADDEFQGVLGSDLNERIETAIEGLSPAQQVEARQRLQSYVLQSAQAVIRARDNYIKGELATDFARREIEILKSPASREERLADYEQVQLDKAQKELIAPQDVPRNVVNFEGRLDESDFDRLKLENPTELRDRLYNDADFLPTFRENRYQKILEIESYLRTRAREGEVATRKDIAFTVAAILSPNTPEDRRAELESPSTAAALVENLPDDQDRVIAQGLIGYAIQTRNTLKDLGSKDIVELTQAKADLQPPVYIDGVSNLDLSKFEQIYNVSTKAIEAVEKERKENGASFYKIGENESPLSSATLEGIVDSQLSYHRLDKSKNLTPQELRRLHQGGINGHDFRLMSDQAIMQQGQDYRGTQNGVERRAFMQNIQDEAGSLYAPLLIAEMARKEGKQNGIGLPYRAMMYTEVREAGTIQNLYNAEENAASNRENVRQLFGQADQKLTDVQTEIFSNDEIRDYLNSFSIDPGAEAVRQEFQTFITDYVLELGRRQPPISLSDAVRMAADHLVTDNYVFIQPNPETVKVRLKNSQIKTLPAGKVEEALTQYTGRLLAERRQGMIDLAGSDDLWAWKVRGDEKGLELVFLNENRGVQYSSRQIIMPFDELLQITEKHMNGDADLFLSDQAKQQANEILDEKFGPVERPAAPIEEAAPAMATDRRSRAMRKEAEPAPPPEEPAALPPDQDLLTTQSFLSRARDFEPSVTGTDQMVVVERLIEGADIIQQKLQVLGAPKTVTEKRSREKLMRELRLLETQLDLIQGNTASKEQIRNLVGDKPEVDPETRKMLEDLLNRRK